MKKLACLLIAALLLCSCVMAEEIEPIVDLVKAETGTPFTIEMENLTIECVVPENVDVITHKSTKAECEVVGYSYKAIQERWKELGEQFRMIDAARTWEFGLTMWAASGADYVDMTSKRIEVERAKVEEEYKRDYHIDKIFVSEVRRSEKHAYVYHEVKTYRGKTALEYRTDVNGITISVTLNMIDENHVDEAREMLKQFMGSMVIKDFGESLLMTEK